MASDRYGLGLQFNKISDIEFIGHSGGYPGFSTYTAHYTEYTVSILINANERLPVTIASALVKVLKKINATFTTHELSQAVIGGPLVDKWGSFLVVLAKKKGLYLSLNSWDSCDDALLLTSKNGVDFLCEKEEGGGSVGEKITFQKDKDGSILSVKWGSHTISLEDTFLTNFEKTVLRTGP